MDTVVTSMSRQVHIGPRQPFVIIGERINPTGRSQLAAELAAGDFQRVRRDALAQVAAGAHVLDVNAGIAMADEPALLAEAIRQVQSVVDVPLSIDSSVAAALEAGLAAYRGKALVNSVTGEAERLETVLPLVKQHGAAVIGIANDESGISEDPEVRVAVAKKIVERAEAHGIPRQDVIIDPLAMPVGAVPTASRTVFTVLRRVRQELGVNTVCGASNISFGLPARPALNAAFLLMAMACGLTCALTNPLEHSILVSVRAADLLLGRDENCQAWLRAHRAQSGGGEGRRTADEARQRARSSSLPNG